MAPQVKQFLDTSRAVGQKGYDVVSRFILWLLSLVALFLDFVYDRFDLWQNKERRIASFKKIRSLVMYSVVIGIDIYVIASSYKPPTWFLFWSMMGLLAASFGENVFMSFLEVLGRKYGSKYGSGVGFGPPLPPTMPMPPPVSTMPNSSSPPENPIV